MAVKFGEFKQEGQKKLDMVLKASEDDISTPEKLYDSLIAIPGGKVLPVSALSRLERTTGITQIRHLERQRTITLQVTPPVSLPLQEAMEIINSKVVARLSGQEVLRGVDIGQSGVADKLTENPPEPAVELYTGSGDFLLADGRPVRQFYLSSYHHV